MSLLDTLESPSQAVLDLPLHPYLEMGKPVQQSSQGDRLLITLAITGRPSNLEKNLDNPLDNW